MKSSLSDYVARSMQQVLNSKEHQSLYHNYKAASAPGSESTEECDVSQADDSEKEEVEVDTSDAQDDSLTKDDHYKVAVDSLLTASASLDNLGFVENSALTLKLASLIVEAKKKDKDVEKEKAAKEKAKMKAEKDKQAAKDKALKEKEKEKAAKEKEKAKLKAEKEKAAAKAKK